MRKQQEQPDGASKPAELWGRELQYWRSEVRGLKQAELAARMHCDPSFLSQLENGRRVPKAQFVGQLDKELATDGALTRQLAYLRVDVSDYHPSWYQGYVELERKAVAMWEWQPYYLSGLFQTEAYARALFASAGHSPAKVDELTEARLGRQGILYRENPLELTVVMDESVLWRQVGGLTVAVDQLKHLLAVSSLPNVRLHLVPREAGVIGPGELMTFLDLPGQLRWFYTENLNRGYGTNSQLEVREREARYDRARASALSVKQSRLLIRRVMGELINMNPLRQSVNPSSVSWYKASYSADENGNCIEISADLLSAGQVPIRDSKDPNGPNLLFSREAFAAFRKAVVAGEFVFGERHVAA
ncbi:Scr1 family TA system antitoxin-like transcriptional regulator [Kitasatospora sp. HPMI-4]|uniref:Scr1 family TA system antitoxin-like transcriptional regulator n=1 Tax=Kitasatospora sp. HPMI-4 TaxID=3448443 RepID=UPI003F1D1D73